MLAKEVQPNQPVVFGDEILIRGTHQWGVETITFLVIGEIKESKPWFYDSLVDAPMEYDLNESALVNDLSVILGGEVTSSLAKCLNMAIDALDPDMSRYEIVLLREELIKQKASLGLK